MVTPWAPRGGPLDSPAELGRVLAAITVSGWRPCLSRARMPVTSRLGQTTPAEVSGPLVAPIPARWSRHWARSWSAGAATSGPASLGTRVKRSAAPQVWLSESGPMCWCTQTPRPATRPLSALTTSGSPQPAGSVIGSGSSGSMACQRRPTARLMSRTASRTTHGMCHLQQARRKGFGATIARTLPPDKSRYSGHRAFAAGAAVRRADQTPAACIPRSSCLSSLISSRIRAATSN